MDKLIIDKSESILTYPVICDSYANLDNAFDIWKKFSNYVKSEELSFMDRIIERGITSLSQLELEKYYKIKEQIDFFNLLPKYEKKECTKEEHDQVVKFMNNSLTEFVDSRLSDELKNNAKQFVSKLFKEQTLQAYIELKQEKYESLTIYEAYILFIAKEKLYHKTNNKLNEKIINEQKERDIILNKNLNIDYGYKF